MPRLNLDKLRRKFSTLTKSKESIQGLSHWIISHKDCHVEITVNWLKAMERADLSHRLTLLYVANDVLQHCKRKGAPEYRTAFLQVLPDAIMLVKDEKIREQVLRIIAIWSERNVYTDGYLRELKDKLHTYYPSPMPNSSPEDTPEIGESELTEAEIIANFKSKDLFASTKQLLQLQKEALEKFNTYNSRANMDLLKLNSIDIRINDDKPDLHHRFIYLAHDLENFVQAAEKEIAQRKRMVGLVERSQVFYAKQHEEVRRVVHAYRIFGRKVNNLQQKLNEKMEMLPIESPIPSPEVEEYVPEIEVSPVTPGTADSQMSESSNQGVTSAKQIEITPPSLTNTDTSSAFLSHLKISDKTVLENILQHVQQINKMSSNTKVETIAKLIDPRLSSIETVNPIPNVFVKGEDTHKGTNQLHPKDDKKITEEPALPQIKVPTSDVNKSTNEIENDYILSFIETEKEMNRRNSLTPTTATNITSYIPQAEVSQFSQMEANKGAPSNQTQPSCKKAASLAIPLNVSTQGYMGYRNIQPSPHGNMQPSPHGNMLLSPHGTMLPSPHGNMLPSPHGNKQPSPCKDMQPSPCGNTQPSPSGNMQPSPGNMQPSPSGNMQPSPGNMQPSPSGNMQPSPGNVQPSSSGNMQPSPGNMQPSSSGNMQLSPGNMQPSPGRIQHSPYGNIQPSPSGNLQPLLSENMQSLPSGNMQPSPHGNMQPSENNNLIHNSLINMQSYSTNYMDNITTYPSSFTNNTEPTAVTSANSIQDEHTSTTDVLNTNASKANGEVLTHSPVETSPDTSGSQSKDQQDTKLCLLKSMCLLNRVLSESSVKEKWISSSTCKPQPLPLKCIFKVLSTCLNSGSSLNKTLNQSEKDTKSNINTLSSQVEITNKSNSSYNSYDKSIDCEPMDMEIETDDES